MKRTMAKSLIVFALAVAALSLAACQQQATTVSTTPGKTELQYGGTLIIAVDGVVRSMDPQQETLGYNLQTVAPATDSIIRYDPLDATDSTYVPGLAEKWELSADGKTITFYFTKNATWSDGVPFTAKDAKFSLERIIRPPSGVLSQRGAWFKNVDNVQVVDDYTMKLNLKQPQPSIYHMLAYPWTTVIPQHVIEKEGQDALKRKVVGTGPFKMVAYDDGVSARFEKRNDYFMKGLPYLDAIELYYFVDPVAAQAAFKTGKTDVGSVAAPEVKTFGKDKPRYQLMDLSKVHNLVFRFDHTRPPFNDIRVRKAVHLITDRDAENEASYDGRAKIGGPMPAGGNFAIPEEEIRKMPGFRKDKTEDIKEAKRLMAEAGYPNGFRTPFLFSYQNDYNQAALVVVDQWRKTLNIEIDGEKYDTATINAKYDKKEFFVGVWGTGNNFDDPDDVLNIVYSCAGTRNYGKYCNPKLDELIAEQSRTLDPVKRKQLTRQAQDIIIDEVPQMLLHWSPLSTYLPPWVKNFTYHSGTYGVYRNERVVWLDRNDPDYPRR